MGKKKRSYNGWLDDFSLVLTRNAVRSQQRNPNFDAFAGSKLLASAWLVVIAAIAGAFGGTLASSALWRSPLQIPLWLAAFVGFCLVGRKATLALSGPYLGFLTGWCTAWGLLIGICAMWAAQRSGSGAAYGIAIGVGFLIALIQGGYEPDDLKGRDAFFVLGLLTGPGGATLAAWLHRNVLPDPDSLGTAALTGAVAGLVFPGPVMGFLLARLNNVEGLRRLASLLLHNDETAPEALPVLDSAVRLAPDDADLIERRAFVYTLLGRSEAEADWARHVALLPKSSAREIIQGWVQLRRDRAADAVIWFEKAAAGTPETRAAIGLGIARLRAGNAAGAAAALEAIAGGSHDARSLTYLAEAHLAAGNARLAAQTATDAIDELDSIHGRTWIVRGDARRAMGDIDGAAKDYNKALWADEEQGVEEQAMARLDQIGRPVEEPDPDTARPD